MSTERIVNQPLQSTDSNCQFANLNSSSTHEFIVVNIPNKKGIIDRSVIWKGWNMVNKRVERTIVEVKYEKTETPFKFQRYNIPDNLCIYKNFAAFGTWQILIPAIYVIIIIFIHQLFVERNCLLASTSCLKVELNINKISSFVTLQNQMKLHHSHTWEIRSVIKDLKTSFQVSRPNFTSYWKSMNF